MQSIFAIANLASLASRPFRGSGLRNNAFDLVA
jgi:hypothetical protein